MAEESVYIKATVYLKFQPGLRVDGLGDVQWKIHGMMESLTEIPNNYLESIKILDAEPVHQAEFDRISDWAEDGL
jgi:hypothetical protein